MADGFGLSYGSDIEVSSDRVSGSNDGFMENDGLNDVDQTFVYSGSYGEDQEVKDLQHKTSYKVDMNG